MEPHRNEKAGLAGPRSPARARPIPDEKFDELFALLPSHRDRALAAFWVSTSARASELLRATAGDADAGQQLITVIRKGSRRMQRLPASPDAFVWLRLYRRDAATWSGRAGPAAVADAAPPVRQLGYHAAYRMISRPVPRWARTDTARPASHGDLRMARGPGCRSPTCSGSSGTLS